MRNIALAALIFIAIFVLPVMAQEKPAFVSQDMSIEILVKNDNYVLSLITTPKMKMIRFDGVFVYGVVGTIEMQSRKHGATILSLNSAGGAPMAGFNLAKSIKEHDTPVVILGNDICHSACAFAAIASPNLTIQGELGFHYAYYSEWSLRKTDESLVAESINLALVSIEHMVKYGISLQATLDMFADANSHTLAIISNNDDYEKIREGGDYSLSAYKVRDLRISQ